MEEKVINGVLSYLSNGVWVPYTAKELTDRLPKQYSYKRMRREEEMLLERLKKILKEDFDSNMFAGDWQFSNHFVNFICKYKIDLKKLIMELTTIHHSKITQDGSE